MLGRDTVAGVACSFLVTYYREFVKEKEIVGLVELYGESSVITYAGYNEETTVVARGRHEIAQHLGKMDDALGRRKVEVRFADYTPLPGGCIHIVCQGIMYLRGQRRAFFQVFVLAPTQYRTNTYHIAIDYFRVMVVEVEQIPEDSIIMTPAQVAQHLLEEHERRKRLEESREQLRRQQAAAEALRLQQMEEAARRKEFHQARGEPDPRRERQNNGTHHSTSNRRDRVERNDDGRRDRTDARRVGHSEVGNTKSSRPERAERNNGRYDERSERNGERRWERQDGMRGERGQNVKSREEKGGSEGAPASQPTRPLRSREQPNTAAAKPENGDSKPNINKPVPRSKAALERRVDMRAEGEEGAAHNSAHKREAAASRRGPEAASKEEGARKKTAPTTTTAAAAAAAPAAAAAATGNAKDAARARPPANRTGSTDYARLVRVPKYVKLTDIKTAVTSVLGAEPIDAYWYGRSSADCVLQLRSSSAVEQLVRDSVMVLESKLTAVKFYP